MTNVEKEFIGQIVESGGEPGQLDGPTNTNLSVSEAGPRQAFTTTEEEAARINAEARNRLWGGKPIR